MTYEARKTLQREIEDKIDCKPYLVRDHVGRGYVCPRCKSGEREDGALTYYASTHRCYCHACNQRVSVFDLVMYRQGMTFTQAFEYLKGEMEGTVEKPFDSFPLTPSFTASTPTVKEENQDFTGYYRRCMKRLYDERSQTYLSFRGISVETALRCMVGFDPDADPLFVPGGRQLKDTRYHFPRLIFPCSRGWYTTRHIKDTGEKSDKLNTAGSVVPYGLWALKGAGPIFIVEGAFDMLSIEECGFHAIALHGRGQYNRLLARPEVKESKCSFILCPDNDPEPENVETLRKFTALKAGLDAMGKKAIIAKVSGQYKDANDRLKAGDKEGLREILLDVVQAI